MNERVSVAWLYHHDMKFISVAVQRIGIDPLRSVKVLGNDYTLSSCVIHTMIDNLAVPGFFGTA